MARRRSPRHPRASRASRAAPSLDAVAARQRCCASRGTRNEAGRRRSSSSARSGRRRRRRASRRAKARRKTRRRASCPSRRASGPLRRWSTATARRRSASRAIVIGPATPSGRQQRRATIDVKVESARVFFGGRAPAALDLLVAAQAPPTSPSRSSAPHRRRDRRRAGRPACVAPGAVQTHHVGRDRRRHGRPQPRPLRVPRLHRRRPAAQAAQTRRPLATGSFLLLDHKFPVRGKHDYGSGGAAFGAGRAGHSHQGHDVFATCGTPLVAARGGVVKFNQLEAAPATTSSSTARAPTSTTPTCTSQAPAPLKKGDARHDRPARSATSATPATPYGCHLHFEMWSGPGWYTGGAPFDPLPRCRPGTSTRSRSRPCHETPDIPGKRDALDRKLRAAPALGSA